MSFWGKACAGAAGVVGIYASVAKGTYNVATGKGTFDEGFDVADRMAAAGEKFGDEHGAALNDAAIKVVGAVTSSEIRKHNRPAA